MRSCLERTVLLLVVFIMVAGISPVNGKEPASGEENRAPGPDLQSEKTEIIVSPKTMDRRFDPVVVAGDLLPNLHGLRNDSLRLFAHDGKQFRAIPFQIDERDPEGEFVFTGGKTAGPDIDKGLFDYNDELVFMIKDTGGQVPKAVWSEMGDKGAEIVVSDPRDVSRKGWVYCIHFPDNPPALSEKDYINYYPEEETIRSTYYHLGYREGAPFYMDMSYPREAGGDGEDFFDRVKIRIKIKAFFNVISITKTEEDFLAEVVGWKDGPVRVLRNVQNYFRLLFNLSSPSIFSVNEYYEQLTYTPVQLTIPFNLKYVFNSFGISDWTWHFYGDFPGLKNGKSFTNRNLEGLSFTGNHSRKYIEKNVDLTNLVWGFNTKEGVGTWFPCLVLPEILYGLVSLYVIDDESFIDPPEDVPGVIGAGVEVRWKGINEDLWFLLIKGTYELSLDTYFPRPGMGVDEVDEWLNIRSYPLWVDVGEKHGEVIPATAALSGGGQKSGTESFAKGAGKEDQGYCGLLTDNRGRELSLSKLSFHPGSSRTTPRTFTVGRTTAEEKYTRLEFNDIKRIENYIKDKDPITGMKNPLFQKVTMDDGDVVDILNCKPCGFSGFLPDGKKLFLWNTQVNSVELNECPSP